MIALEPCPTMRLPEITVERAQAFLRHWQLSRARAAFN